MGSNLNSGLTCDRQSVSHEFESYSGLTCDRQSASHDLKSYRGLTCGRQSVSHILHLLLRSKTKFTEDSISLLNQPLSCIRNKSHGQDVEINDLEIKPPGYA